MAKANILQTMLLIAFGGLILLGFAAFALFGAIGGKESDKKVDAGDFTIWGTLSDKVMDSVLESLLNVDHESYRGVKYVQKDLQSFRHEFVSELASGRGPDLVVIPHEEILAQTDRLQKIPYERLPFAMYDNLFIDSANIFLGDDGILALPFVSDPLVLYYNIDIQEKNNIRKIPQYWSDLLGLSHVIEIDGIDIKKALINLGGVNNNRNIKPILSAMFLQVQNRIIEKEADGRLKVTFNKSEHNNESKEVLDFYTQFANPKNALYTWDGSLPEAQTMFSANDLMFYIGFASEYDEIKRSNPNLRFGVAPLPQISKEHRPGNFLRLYGAAIPRSSKRPLVSFNLAVNISYGLKSIYKYDTFSTPTSLTNFTIPADAPTRWSIASNAVLIGKIWYDSTPDKTLEIFQRYIKGIIAGRYNIDEAFLGIGSSLSNILR